MKKKRPGLSMKEARRLKLTNHSDDKCDAWEAGIERDDENGSLIRIEDLEAALRSGRAAPPSAEELRQSEATVNTWRGIEHLNAEIRRLQIARIGDSETINRLMTELEAGRAEPTALRTVNDELATLLDPLERRLTLIEPQPEREKAKRLMADLRVELAGRAAPPPSEEKNEG
jgi:hypothetical protein